MFHRMFAMSAVRTKALRPPLISPHVVIGFASSGVRFRYSDKPSRYEQFHEGRKRSDNMNKTTGKQTVMSSFSVLTTVYDQTAAVV